MKVWRRDRWWHFTIGSSEFWHSPATIKLAKFRLMPSWVRRTWPAVLVIIGFLLEGPSIMFVCFPYVWKGKSSPRGLEMWKNILKNAQSPIIDGPLLFLRFSANPQFFCHNSIHLFHFFRNEQPELISWLSLWSWFAKQVSCVLRINRLGKSDKLNISLFLKFSLVKMILFIAWS